ncbi:flagellar hook basal-body protein [Fodinicurvata sp. EGI_FJ10296]|uniref:flagellar hook-basal body protein n=1 Tax=Fodinicurvata sp. EGI_FJ10296 TaxID=3231908 RepID=UPI0034522DCB
MDATSYIAISGQGALRRQMDVVANNLANMGTTGYKAQGMLFSDYLNLPDRPGPKAGLGIRQVTDLAVTSDHSQGEMEHTGNMMDNALNGPGFFVVETSGGPRYTRSGTFAIDAERRLIDANSLPVLDDNDAPIVIPEDAGQLSISTSGEIESDAGPLGRLKVVEFEDPGTLEPLGGGLFVGNAVPAEAEATEVVQGMREASNVIPIAEMTRMIDISRAYQKTQNILESEHERQRTAIRELPRPRAG